MSVCLRVFLFVAIPDPSYRTSAKSKKNPYFCYEQKIIAYIILEAGSGKVDKPRFWVLRYYGKEFEEIKLCHSLGERVLKSVMFLP